MPRPIKQADAKYLQAPDVAGKDDTPKIEAGSGEDDDEDDDEDEGDPVPQEISQGTVRAVLSYTEEKNEDGDTMHAPVVVVFANDKEIAKLTGEPGFGVPPVSVQIAELDPGNSQPEVVVSFYTGGAHCCSSTSVITSNKDGTAWQTVDVGEFDGGPMLATDLNGDGRYEFEHARQRISLRLRLLCLLGGAARVAHGRERRRQEHHHRRELQAGARGLPQGP